MIRTAAILVCVLLTVLAAAAAAGPLQSELQSYRCLVPDWSKTSGGFSPAISPDGKTLAYLTLDKVWILPGVNRFNPEPDRAMAPEAALEAWPLEAPLPEETANVKVEKLTPHDQDSLMNLEWSPDGTRLALISQGRLYVAEGFDFAAKTARVTLLADVRVVDPAKGEPPLDEMNKNLVGQLQKKFGEPDRLYGLPLEQPRWSPDGTKIAFVRHRYMYRGYASNFRHFLCVVYVSSGKETVVAQDAECFERFPRQPWSPDSAQLLYSAPQYIPQANTWGHGGQIVATIDGSRAPVKIEGLYQAQWSPRTGQLVSCLGPDPTRGLWVSDGYGRNRRQITQRRTPAQVAAEKAMRTRPWRELVETHYKSLLTPAQLKRLRSGRMEESELRSISHVSSARIYAGKIGGDFQRKVENAATAYAEKGKSPFGPVSDAFDVLPDGEERWKEWGNWKGNLEREARSVENRQWADQWAVWSPDGKRVAFLRHDWDNENQQFQLLTVDAATGRTRLLFTADWISNVSWCADGKSLVLQTQRKAGFKRLQAPGGERAGSSYWYMAMGYPEIWLVEPK